MRAECRGRCPRHAPARRRRGRGAHPARRGGHARDARARSDASRGACGTAPGRPARGSADAMVADLRSGAEQLGRDLAGDPRRPGPGALSPPRPVGGRAARQRAAAAAGAEPEYREPEPEYREPEPAVPGAGAGLRRSPSRSWSSEPQYAGAPARGRAAQAATATSCPTVDTEEAMPPRPTASRTCPSRSPTIASPSPSLPPRSGGGGGGAGSEGARLIALNMALNGTPREETAAYLSRELRPPRPGRAARRGLLARRRIAARRAGSSRLG